MEFERWKTLSRSEPDFLAHLEGSFSNQARALPVRSLNVESQAEVVTFEIIPLAEISKPSFVHLIWQLLRPLTLILAIGPMISTLVLCAIRQARGEAIPHWPIAISSFFGVLFFQASLNFFNDYFDHVRGKDRLNPRGGSRAIQNGWVRALDLKRSAWGLLGVAILFGLPVVAMQFTAFAVIAVLALLTGLEFASQRFGLKYKGFGEIMAFALTGPLLTAGYAWAVIGQFTWLDVSLGFIFGAISLMYFHAANFENIMPDSQAGVVTWATRTGFDASKKFFYFTAALTVTASGVFSFLLFYYFQMPLWLVQTLPVLQFAFLLSPVARVSYLASPLSSALVGLRLEAIKLNWLTLAILLGFGSYVYLCTR